MKIMPCPLNGPRNISEFVCQGPFRTIPEQAAPTDQWADYVFLEDNKAGPVVEWWLHVPTAFWFIAERDTRSGEILKTWTLDAFMAERRL